jgi:hypothetical protein
MNRFFLLLVFIFSGIACACQTTNTIHLKADTVTAQVAASQQFDSTVTSFTIFYSVNGVRVERKINGHIVPEFVKRDIRYLKPGSVVLYYDIMAKNEEGKAIKFPPKKYYIE